MKRFWDKVEKTKSCWLWTGSYDKDGYGWFWMDGKNLAAHRAVWFLTFGRDSIPADKVTDHICRNRKCVNPKHLRLVSNADNVLIGIGPTAINKRKTHCPRGHALTEDNLVACKLAIGVRVCCICEKVRNRISKANRREQINAYQRSRRARLASQ